MLEGTGYLGNRIGGSSLVNAAFIAGGALAVVLVLLGFIVAHKYAVVLTDRRLLVFRWSGIFMGHIQDIFIAAARSDVSSDFNSRLGWGGLNVEFAPATGMSPIRLDFWSVDRQIAWSIQHALAATAPVNRGHPHFHPHTGRREPDLTNLHCRLGKRTNQGRLRG